MEKTKLISLLCRIKIASYLSALIVFWLLGRLKYGTATTLLYKRSQFCTLRNSKMYCFLFLFFLFLEESNCSLEQFIICHHAAFDQRNNLTIRTLQCLWATHGGVVTVNISATLSLFQFTLWTTLNVWFLCKLVFFSW